MESTAAGDQTASGFSDTTGNAATISDTPTATLTQIRRRATPYLPPPVIAAMVKFDSHPFITSNISPRTSDEPSTALALTLLLAFVTIQFVRFIGSNAIGGRSTLHIDDEEEYDVLKSGAGSGADSSDKDSDGLGKFGDTVALVGPCGAGKTLMFHSLCAGSGGAADKPQGRQNVITVTSMKASAGLVASSSSSTSGAEDDVPLPVRLIDYPGHPSLRPKLPAVVSASSRLVLTLDSTRPVAEGASLLYSVLTDANVASAWCKAANGASGKVPILVACTKSDIPKSKNWRRIKIQLRTELERLEKVGGVTSSSAPGDAVGEDMDASTGRLSLLDNATGKGGGLDLDNLGDDIPASIHFLSVGGSNGLDALQIFVVDGTVPTTGK